jgi:hypothetical protein
MESKKEYDWSVNKPVEFRPYIKDIAGKRRMLVLTTIAAKREGSKKFDGSATPDLALVDVEYRDVIWVDAKHQDNWDKTIYNQLSSVWRESEPDNQFLKDNLNNIELKDNEQNVETLVSNDSINTIKSELILDPKKASAKDKIKELEAELDSLKIKKLQSEIESIKEKVKDTVE